MGFFLITLDVIIVNLALPGIGRELGGGTAGQQWTIDGYTLMFASLLMFAGNLSERIGAKRAFGAGVVLFTLASIGCALAPTLAMFIAARFVQGAFAAIMLPASMALIREAYTNPYHRARALGVWAMGGGVAVAVGPPLGGFLSTIDWRLVFGINIPVAAIMIVLLGRVAPSGPGSAAFDVPGQITALLGLGALTYWLIDGGENGFISPVAIVTLVLAVAGIGSFIWRQARAKNPMMPLSLFRPRGMRIAVVVGFAFMAGWYGTIFLSTLFLQQHLGLSPLAAGLAFLPSAVLSVVGNLASGPITTRFGARLPAVTGLLSMIVGLVVFAATAPIGSPFLTALLIAPIGVGGSIAMPAVTSVVLDSVAAERAGTASAIFNTFRQVGGAVGIAVFGSLVANRSAFLGGMQVSLLIAAGLVGCATLTAAFIHPNAKR
ncbi:MFS transporter [Arthrobacter sp. SRS-W-1-2016]|nr:MFS transporter [Arthrobacter sp. SRS-W-1-2016]